MHHQPGFGWIDPQLPGSITTHGDQQTIGELQIGGLGLDDIVSFIERRGLFIVAGTIFDDLVAGSNLPSLLRQTDEICALITRLPRVRCTTSR